MRTRLTGWRCYRNRRPRDTWTLELVARADGLPPAVARTLAAHDLSLIDVQTMDGGDHTRAVAVA